MPRAHRHPLASHIAAAVLLAGCAVNPATGRRELMLVSESQEIEMGRQYDQEVTASIGLYPDPALQTYIQALGSRLAATSERPNLPWTFRVVDDPAVNAFALPGGFVYVTRGIMAHMTSEAQLATVLGHEIGHVTARHSAAQMSKQQLAGLGLAIGSIASSQIERYSGLAGQALGVMFLKFSRDNENEADELGVRYSARANFDAREMANVMRLLDRVSSAEGAGRLPEWLATHPNPGNRLEHIAALLAQPHQNFSSAIVNREAYERRLDGIVFGMNPREGFVRGTTFYHPELKFQIAFPGGWKTVNTKQAVAAQSPSQDGVIELSLVKEASAEQAARAFLSTQGMQGGPPRRGSVSGFTSSEVPFAATTESGTLRGNALFVEYGGSVYRLLAYGTDAAWAGHEAVAQRALRSFARLTDPGILAVQPHRVQIVTVDRRTTIAQLAGQRPSPVPVPTLALINQVDDSTPLDPGRVVKWVAGRPLP